VTESRKLFVMGYSKQNGFTLVELLVVLSIIGVLSTAIAMTIGVVMKTSTTAMEQNSALSQVHMAGSWISRDLKNADASEDISETAGDLLCSMTCYVWDEVAQEFREVPETVEYRKEGGELNRKSWPNDTPALVKTSTVAQFLDDANTSFVSDPIGSGGPYYKLTVTAVPGVTKVYRIMRGYLK
jgi:prepilin-type N-terminal cleavage/methylation domain-containing protein